MKVIKLNESDIKRIVKRVLTEQPSTTGDTPLYINPEDEWADSINVKKGNFNITLSIKRSEQNTYILNVLNNDANKYNLVLTDFVELTDNLIDEEYYESEGYYAHPEGTMPGEWKEDYYQKGRNRFEHHLHPINRDNSVELDLTIEDGIKINLMVAFHPAQIKVGNVKIPDVYVK